MIRGGFISVAAHCFIFTLQLAGLLILSRILLPVDFGVFAIALLFVQPLQNLGENLFVDSIVYHGHLEDDQLSSLYWINLTLSIFLTASIIALAKPLASAFDQPSVIEIIYALSPCIIIGAAGATHLAILRQRMNFAKVQFASVISRFLGLSVALICLQFFSNHWILVINYVISATALNCAYWIFAPWSPRTRVTRCGLSKPIAYGIASIGRFYVDYFSRNLDNFIMASFFGPAPLAIYKKAFDLFSIATNAIATPLSSVAFSGFTRIRDSPGKFKSYYLKVITVIAFFGMILSGLLLLSGQELVVIALGEKWRESGVLFSMFAPAIGVMLLYRTTTWLHLSLGTPGTWLRWTLLESMILALAIVAGSHWGAKGLAIAWVVSYSMLLVPAILIGGKAVSISFNDIVCSCVPFLACAILAGSLVFALRLMNLVDSAHSFCLPPDLELLFMLAAFFLLYLMFSLLGPWKQKTLSSLQFTCTLILGAASRSR